MPNCRVWRSAAFLLIAVLAPSLFAQYQTPTLDGVVSPGEYTHSSGNWAVTWDATYLYIANSAANTATVIYLDTDVKDSSISGTNANGNLTGVSESVPGATTSFGPPALPFRADAHVRAGNGEALLTRDGSGGWGNQSTDSNDITSAINGSTREIRIRWAAIPGLTAIPITFSWLAFDVYESATVTTATNYVPSNNSGGNFAYFFHDNYTGDGFAADPFGQLHHIIYVTSNADSGAGTLRDAIGISNADSSARRHIVFNMPGNTIQLLTNLPALSNGGWIIDGTTQPGYVSAPIVVLRGTDPNDSATPSYGLNVGGSAVYSVYKGLIFQNAYYGMYSTDGFTATLENCWFGVDSTGLVAAPNSYGVRLFDWDNSTIKNCIFSGNTIMGAALPASGPQLLNDTFGLGSDGTTIIPNSHGLSCTGGYVQIGSQNNAAAGNVFAGLTGDAITVDQCYAYIYGNKIGVAADGTTARSNSGAGIKVTDSEAYIGSRTQPESANIIANNAGGVTVIKNSSNPGVVVSRNTMYANTSHGISLTGSGVLQPTPVISSAALDGSGNLTVTYSLTLHPSTPRSPQRILLELFDADLTNASIPQGKTWRASTNFDQNADIVNGTWNLGSGFSAGDKLVMNASSYGNSGYNVAGDGTSPFSAAATVTFSADKVFTGPGSFSDATKWNGGTLPATGQSIQILNACTFDTASGTTTYGTLFLGDGTATGSVTFQPGGSAVLHVNGITSFTTGSAIDMTSGGTLQVDGTWNTAKMTFTRGVGTVVFGGTGQSAPSIDYTNVTIAGSVSGSTSPIIHGALVVNSGAGFVNADVQLSDSASIGGSGALAFNSLTIATGANVTHSRSFLTNTFVINGTFNTSDPYIVTATGAISGSGTLTMAGGGTLQVGSTWSVNNLSFVRGTGTIEYNGISQTLALVSYNNLTISGSVSAIDLSTTASVFGNLLVNAGGSFAPSSGTVLMRGAPASIGGAGTIQFASLTIVSGAAVTAGSSFSVNGPFFIHGTFTPDSGVVVSGTVLNGTGTAVVTGSSVASQYAITTRNLTAMTLRIDNNAGVTLGASVSAGNLVLTNGVLTTGGNTLAVAGTVTTTNGRINGSLTRTVASGTNVYAFPVGTASFSMPVSATVTSSNIGTVTFGATAGEHPQVATAGISSSKDVNGYWTYTPGTASVSTFNAAFTFNGNIDGSASPTTFVLRAYRSSAWSNLPATAASTSITSTGGISGTSAADFVAGNSAIDHYTVTAGTPQTINVAFLTTVTAVDSFGAPIADATGSVTMTSNSNHVKFDADGNGNFNDNVKTLTNGTLTISTRDNTAESMTITATDGSSKTGTSTTIVVAGTISAATSTITANPTSINTGGATSTITVQARDSNGTSLVTGGATVTLNTTLGTLGSVTDNNNGTYTATLTSGATGGTATITGTINTVAMTNSATVTIVLVNHPKSDINNNGRSDLVWRNTATGEISAWYVNGGTLEGGATLPTVANQNLDIMGTGDFNGDGTADLLWRNLSTGENFVWYMSNGSLVGGVTLPTVLSPGLGIAGIGDFNADGFADILWRNTTTGENSIWYCNASGLIGGGSIPSVNIAGFTVVAVADFNHDGKSDILWRNTNNGENYTWLMNGITLTGGSQLPTVLSAGLSIAAVGDFNNDGTADLLWRNTNSGENSIWRITNGALTGGGSLPSIAGTALSIVATGDFDGDGDSDLIWRNSTNGENYVWQIQNNALAGGGQLPTVAGNQVNIRTPAPR